MNLPFSKSRVSNGLVFLSGELALEADGTLPEGIRAQTELVIARVRRTLEAHGLSLRNVVQTTVHLVDPNDFSGFNEIYRQFFTDPKPVRTTVLAGLLVSGALVEITVVAEQ